MRRHGKTASARAVEGELANAVRKGRRREYAWAYAKYGDEVPDPLEPSTFRSAVLDWDARNEAAGAARLALVRQLLAIRHREIVPRLADAAFGEAQAAGNGLLTATWRMADGATLALLANLSDRAVPHGGRQFTGTQLWGGKTGDLLPPWSVAWHLGAR